MIVICAVFHQVIITVASAALNCSGKVLLVFFFKKTKKMERENGWIELGACAREEQGRETAVARVPAQGHTRVGAPRGAPEAVPRWGERGAKTGQFMVEREAEHEKEISTDDEEE
jgi:hypothetical protein